MLKQARQAVEDLLLPAVEDRGLDGMFLAQVGDRLAVNQMLADDDGLLLGREVLAMFRHSQTLLVG